MAACLFARDLQLQHFALASMDDRKLVISNCAVGGRTIEQLSKGVSPELFNRLRVMSAAGKAAAQAANLTYGIPAVLWLQGEYNYVPDFGGSISKSSYKAKLAQLISDIKSELVPNQSKPPALIMYQTGGQYTSDAADLSIGDAQWELSQEMAGVFIATPSYPFTDKGGHLTPNGYRWMALYFRKVLHEVLTLRRILAAVEPSVHRGQGTHHPRQLPRPCAASAVPSFLGGDDACRSLDQGVHCHR
ncbi:sialate O-acetylesterase [Methylobacterium nodulans]|uniref:Sialate O-acetylesterase domain-containing protein n=1 Tax=Methylobacterium nodulans (strain LMG 21967 / CNCM I-2342 / ORS 2060) TaxID=460265 RepID=B8IES7_METNO|nr:sialate O-acetylesterase [Methylobacterium nodulans]ACL61420.1 conserved hypothetical protein [Methylobacterium nodulans ORS 2060]